MSDVILVVLTQPEKAPAVLNAAAHLAALLADARLNVLAVQEPLRTGALETEILMMEPEIIFAMRKQAKERLAALEAAFEHWAAGAGPVAATARWIEVERSAAVVIAERGSRADIIVAGQPDGEDGLSRQAFRAALFGTGRPVLMVPAGWAGPFGREIAIAWRDDKQATRAVIPVLRCLAAAGRVHVLTGMRDRVGHPVIPGILVEHGIHADLHVLPLGSGPFGQTLLHKAHELGADLLVMGAHAHSPLRELILGGVTRFMLGHADLPVLLRH